MFCRTSIKYPLNEDGDLVPGCCVARITIVVANNSGDVAVNTTSLGKSVMVREFAAFPLSDADLYSRLGVATDIFGEKETYMFPPLCDFPQMRHIRIIRTVAQDMTPWCPQCDSKTPMDYLMD